MDPARIESYVARKPPKKDNDGNVVEKALAVAFAHCVDCGETQELDGEAAEALGHGDEITKR